MSHLQRKSCEKQNVHRYDRFKSVNILIKFVVNEKRTATEFSKYNNQFIKLKKKNKSFSRIYFVLFGIRLLSMFFFLVTSLRIPTTTVIIEILAHGFRQHFRKICHIFISNSQMIDCLFTNFYSGSVTSFRRTMFR